MLHLTNGWNLFLINYFFQVWCWGTKAYFSLLKLYLGSKLLNLLQKQLSEAGTEILPVNSQKSRQNSKKLQLIGACFFCNTLLYSEATPLLSWKEILLLSWVNDILTLKLISQKKNTHVQILIRINGEYR